jgi:hypothetical protein
MSINVSKFVFSRVVAFGMKDGWADMAKLTNNFLKVVARGLKNADYNELNRNFRTLFERPKSINPLWSPNVHA